MKQKNEGVPAELRAAAHVRYLKLIDDIYELVNGNGASSSLCKRIKNLVPVGLSRVAFDLDGIMPMTMTYDMIYKLITTYKPIEYTDEELFGIDL